MLEGWADLDQLEMDADIDAGQPILIDPQSRIDPVLARVFRRARLLVRRARSLPA
jgi:hypothetical protein